MRKGIVLTVKTNIQDMMTDDKIVKYALDLQGIDLDKLMIADSAQILEAFKWLKKHVSGWQANEDNQGTKSALPIDSIIDSHSGGFKIIFMPSETMQRGKATLIIHPDDVPPYYR